MASPTEENVKAYQDFRDRPARNMALSGLLAAGVIALTLLERGFPRPLPWARPGLGNSMILTSLKISGARAALGVALAKVICSSLLSGGLGGPAFFMALAGTAASFGVMWLLNVHCRGLSEIGLSLAGAFAHSMAQLGVISATLASGGVFMAQAGPMTLFSLSAGYAAGVICRLAMGSLLRATNQGGKDVHP